MARNIGEFKYDPGVFSFKTWLLQVTRSRLLNQLRKERRHASGRAENPNDASGTSYLERLPDPCGNRLEALWDEEWAKNLMDAAIQRVKKRVEIEQFQMFDFYVLRKWPVRKVADTLKVNVGRVYLAKHRVSKLVREEIEKLEARGY